MTLSLALLPELAGLFVLVFARIGSMTMLMPGFGEQFFSRRMRLTLALMLTLAMLPLVRASFGTLPREVPGLIMLLVSEIVIGLFIGAAIRLVVGTLATAGTVIAQQIGLGFVTQIDPTQGAQSVILANLMVLLGVLMVFALDLHLLAIAAMHNSYALFRPGFEAPVGDFARAALMVFAGSFVLAMQIAAPFLVAGIVFQVAMGVLSRLMPQLQILFLALPAQLLAGFALLMVLLGTAMTWYGTHVETAIGRFIVR
jgi:flagellar biosynthesis protein FliR